MTTINKTNLNFEREPLTAPWGFKGGFLTEIWQIAASLSTDDGHVGTGLGTQSVLWCDPRVFVAHSEPAGNALMLAITDFALSKVRGTEFINPFDLLDFLLEPTLDYARNMTGLSDIQERFVLNALVSVDNAAWVLHSRMNGNPGFDALIPASLRAALTTRQTSVICSPAAGYGLAVNEIVNLAKQGYFVFKIKIGSDPDKDGDYQKMLDWDCKRLADIHNIMKDVECAGSPTSHALYYLDANGRYDSLDRLMRLVDYAESIGALERTILLEEPFSERSDTPVHSIPIRIVADESATTVAETSGRIDLGYGAVALKPIAKTMSMSLRVAKLCHDRGIPAFCADLTVNPIMVDWNKVIAARLQSITGLDGGLQEMNGFQNYRNWNRMETNHPRAGASWTKVHNGRWELGSNFYDADGGIFDTATDAGR